MASLIVIVTVALACAVTDTEDVPGGIAKNSYAVSVAELVDEDVLNVSVTLVATAECDTVSLPSVALIVAEEALAQVTVGHATVVPRLITLIVPLPVLVNVDSDEKHIPSRSHPQPLTSLLQSVALRQGGQACTGYSQQRHHSAV